MATRELGVHLALAHEADRDLEEVPQEGQPGEGTLDCLMCDIN